MRLMSRTTRVAVAIIILLLLEAGFLFGALATLEPVPNNVAWRIGYVVAAVACLVAFVLLMRANRQASAKA